jgi:phosphatidylglycerophosphate synthase
MTLSAYRKISYISFLSVIVLIFAINFAFVQGAFLTDYIRMPYWWAIYLVLIPQFLISYFYILKKASSHKTMAVVGKKYIMTLTLRMFLAIIFLFPWLIVKDETSKPMVGQFFFVFFPLLVVEIKLLVSYLNQSVPEIKEEE